MQHARIERTVQYGWSRLGSIVLLAAGLSGCAGAPAHDGATSLTAGGAELAPLVVTDPVVLVTIDGLRWQEVFTGIDPALAAGALRIETAAELMPHLHAL